MDGPYLRPLVDEAMLATVCQQVGKGGAGKIRGDTQRMTYEAVPHTRQPGAIDEPFMRLVAAMAGPRHEVAEADERSYREFIEALGVAVYTTDADGGITFYNEAAAELWGRRPAL